MTDGPLKSDESQSPIVVGANHHSSTMMMRDRIFVEDQLVPDFLSQLAEHGLDQAIFLATCDRVEVIGITDDIMGFEACVLQALAHKGGCSVEDLKEQTYTLTDEKAVSHIFTVTSSLDSLMVGEPQVLGQVKHAHRMARELGFIKAELETVMQAAYSTAKRVRNETKIGDGPVGMAASAVQIAKDIFGDLERCKVLLIGVGDMGELIARDLLAAGVLDLTITHQHEYRATDLAIALNAHVADFSLLDKCLCEHDIILSSLGSRSFHLQKKSVAAAIKTRRYKPLFIVDAGVPGDVLDDVEDIQEAFVYGLGDLEKVALKSRAEREQEAGQAKVIIDQEVTSFLQMRAERAATPALTRLQMYFETERKKALLDGDGDAEKATRLLAGRLLHGPSEALRHVAARDEASWAQLEYALEKLFDLKNQDENAVKDKS